MPVAEKTRAAKQEVQRLASSEVRPLDLVDPSKFYRCVLQLGQPWRTYGGGKFKEDEAKQRVDARGMKVRTYQFTPAIHETDVLSGRIVNGLISAHNDWEADNKAHIPTGDIRRMIVVLKVEETDDAPSGRENREAALAKYITEGIVKGLIAAGVINKK